MTLDRRHVPISVYGFDDDMLAGAGRRSDRRRGGVTDQRRLLQHPHPDHPVTMLAPDEAEHDLVWNVGIGMRHPDPALREAIEAALDHLSADGTISRIYARYGVTLQPPR